MRTTRTCRKRSFSFLWPEAEAGGIVFRARDLSLGRDVALKLLMPGLASEEQFVRRFQREAQTVAALKHPNVVGVLSCGEQDGIHFFAMDYVAGRDLGQILEERGTLPLDEALSITAQIADALDQASARGIVHRDVKPSNILIDETGRALITDFGIARFTESQGQLTTTGQFIGTVEYASPEQARGEVVDVRSDVYSLGGVLYRMLCGRPSGGSPVAVLLKISTERPTPIGQLDPTVPAPVLNLVERMIAAPATRNTLRWATRVGAALGSFAAVVLLVWSVESGIDLRDPTDAPKDPTIYVQGPPDETPVEHSTTPPTVTPLPPRPREVAATSERPAALRPPSPPVAAAPPAGPATRPSIPEQPNVLVLVSGDEPMVPAVRAHLESLFQRSGLRLVSTARFPVLRAKHQAGQLSLYWYDVVQLLPANTAQILVLAEIRKTGSTTLRYYGRRQEMTLARFSVQTVDAKTRASIHSGSAPSIEFTSLNMGQNLNQAIEPVVAGIGASITKHWKRRLEHDAS